MTLDQLSVFVENRPGKLVEVIETIGAAGIDLRAMSIADTADFGVLRLIVDKPDSAFKTLTEAGYVVKVNKVLPVTIDDTPGSLGKVLRLLSDNGVNVEYLYAFVAHGKDRAYVIIRVEDNDAATKVLDGAGIPLASAAEIYAQ
ncbi:MAG: ACT domain-containing protein [Oscillospiraceae bacterium]|jgi:hypothetical protein|nr:ACT domain-containing protein [Oscillospiraceae bacterium]